MPVPSPDTMALDSKINGTQANSLFDETASQPFEPLTKTSEEAFTANQEVIVNGGAATESAPEAANDVPPRDQSLPLQAAASLADPIKTPEPPSIPAATEAPMSNICDKPAPIDLATTGGVLATDVSPEKVQSGVAVIDLNASQGTDMSGEDMDTAEDKPDIAPEPAAEQAQPEATAPPAQDTSVQEATADVPPPLLTEGPAAPPADQEMMDAPSSAKVRGREDDEEEERGPSPKRTKTDGEINDAPVEFKVPEQPASATTAPSQGPTPAQTPDNMSVASTNGAAPMGYPQTAAILQPWVSYDEQPMTKPQQKFLLDRLRTAKKIKAALAYLRPVDAIALNIPTYPQIITKPMDMTTMENKLKNFEYPSVDNFMADWHLMIQNSYTFNGPEHPVVKEGANLHAYFKKGLGHLPKQNEPAPPQAEKKPKKPTVSTSVPKAPARRESRQLSGSGTARSPPTATSTSFPLGPDGQPLLRRDSTNERPKREIRPPHRDLPYQKPRKKKYQAELKFCDTVLHEMQKQKYQKISYPFQFPVDPVALNIPHYWKIVKHPIALSDIQQKLKSGEYQKAKEFHDDIKLMFDNCYKFNPPTDEVYKLGKAYDDVFQQQWAKKDQWVEEHTPQSAPMSPVSQGDDEDVSEEEDQHETDEQARLLAIQQQIAALASEAQALTATRNRASPKAAATKKSKTKATKPKKAAAPAPTVKAKKPAKPAKKVRQITYEEKQEISQAFSELDDTTEAMEIIRRGVPSLRDIATEEIELDIDTIPMEVLHELLKYKRKHLGGPPAAAEISPDEDYYEPPSRKNTGTAGPGARRKNKPMTATEQENNIADIKARLAQFGAGSGATPQAAQPNYQESSDDDDSASESEEE